MQKLQRSNCCELVLDCCLKIGIKSVIVEISFQCIVHSLEKHLQSRHKGLFNLYSNNKSLDKSKKHQNRSRSFDDEMEIIEPIIKTENENSFSEVFIETFKPLSDSSSSESDSSSQHRYHNKRKTKRKSRTEEKKSYRRLKDQIDLFQRNVDIKLNYLAGLIQTLVKNQTVQTQKPTCAMSKKTRSDKNRRLKVCSPITIQVPSSSYSARSEELFDCIEMPNFPISGKDECHQSIYYFTFCLA